jgi:hypothetical protein
LKDLISRRTGQNGERFKRSLQNFINFLLEGKIPDSVRPLFFGASLLALQKKDGGVRPIAVGNVWRRLVSKIICNRITPVISTRLSPHQLGVGIKNGAEVGAHTARLYFSSLAHTGIKAFLKIDFRNAFNELRRDVLLEEAKLHCTTFYPFISQAYQFDSNLFLQKSTIKSRCGVHQGDPLGPALFALALHPLIEDVLSEFNVWYLDDGTIADDPVVVLAELKKIIVRAKEIGLELNPSKCELALIGATPSECDLWTEEFSEIAPGIKHISQSNAFLLGSALTDESVKTVLGMKTQNFKLMASRLSLLTSHSAFFLLRASVSIPRLIFFLRCAPTWRQPEALSHYDDALKSCLEDILNCTLTDSSWKQSSLPVNLGGLGIRHATESAIPCFLASFHSCLPLIEELLPEVIISSDGSRSEATELWQMNNAENPEETTTHLQSSWEFPLFKNLQQELLSTSSDQESKARLLAASEPYAGAWLLTLPSPQLGTHLSNECFRISSALRLGGKVGQGHICPCGEEVKEDGLHGLACRRSAGRHSRHASENEVIQRALRSADVPSILEPTGCFRSDGKRADGMTLIPWKKGRPLLWDFTCKDTFAPSYVPVTSRHPGHAAKLGEVSKHKLYASAQGQYHFVPVALETSGVWGKEGISLIKEIGRRITEATGEPRATSYLIQRLSICLQRGNVASILGTLPPGRELDEIFLL